MSFLDRAIESARQIATHPKDDKFLKNTPYFFELKVPQEIGSFFGTSFLFPLVLNPDGITMTEPFTVEATPTAGGGLYVEENGIVQRTLRIRGHTGFKPRRYRGANFANIKPPEERSFGRRNALVSAFTAISGHRHFQYLQDAVFRTYADLKRDPSTSDGTSLIFHNPKDDEHWLVAPQSFTLDRTAADRVLYRYTIELLVVGKATANDTDFSEDKSIFAWIRDIIRKVKSVVDTATAIVQEIQALVGEIKRFVDDIAKIVDSVGNFLNTITDFLDGASDFVRQPFKSITDSWDSVEGAAGRLFAANVSTSPIPGSPDEVEPVPDAVLQNCRELEDALARMGTIPEVFISPTQRAIERLQNLQELSTNSTQADMESAAETPVTSFQQLRKLGSGNQPGDLQKSRGDAGLRRALPAYQSTREWTIEQGDSLQNIAARFLGDARLWRHIAVINQLKAPYITPQRCPETATIGDKILVPSFAKAPSQRPTLCTLGVPLSASPEKRFLGTDWRFERTGPIGRAQFDIPIDVAGGSVDVRLVSGVENAVQGVTVRVKTEKGTDQLYTEVGMDRIIATNIPGIDEFLVQFRLQETILADCRIASIRSIELTSPSPDALEADVVAELRDFSGTTPMTVGVG